MTAPRGIRNNNPGNIVKSSINWPGKIEGPDSRFETFQTPEDGVHALAALLLMYTRRSEPLRTIRKILYRWAPPVENNTDAYVNAVAAEMGYGPDVELDLTDPETLRALAVAIGRHENGKAAFDEHYTDDILDAGISRALGIRVEDVVVEPSPVVQQPQRTTSMAPIAFLLPLLQSLFQVFTPFAQQKLQQTLNKEVKDPEMSTQMAQQIMEIIKQTAAQAGVAAGIVPAVGTQGVQGVQAPPPVSGGTGGKKDIDDVLAAAEAVAIVKNDAALRAKAEMAVLDYLEKLGPLIDKVAALEKESWAAEESSRDAAMRRAQQDTVDLGKPIAMYVLIGFAVVMIGLLAALLFYIWRNPGDPPDPTLVSLLAGAVGVIISKLNTIVDYRFGSSRGSAAKDIMMQEMSRANDQPIVSATPNATVTAKVTSTR
jgi:hypothetical protein